MRKIIKLYNYFFILVPLGIAAVLSVVYMIGGWGFFSLKYVPAHFYLPTLKPMWMLAFGGAFIVLAIVITGAYGTIKGKCKTGTVTTAILFFLTATAVRIIIPYMLKDGIVPFSDFERMWELSHDKLEWNVDYYSLFPAYLNYSVFQKCLIRLLGDSYINVIYVNSILGGATSAGVYILAGNVTKDNNTAIAAGLLYLLMPSGILYTLVGGPDYLTITLNTWGVILLIFSIRASGIRSCAGALIAGILLGIGASYKSFAIIILIAMVMAYTGQLMEKNCEAQMRSNKSSRAMLLILYICIVFAGYGASGRLILNNTEAVFNRELDNSTATPHFLLVGLNTQGEGQISEGDLSREYYEYYLNNNYDQVGAKEHVYTILKEDWRDNTEQIPKLFVKKIVWAWQDDVRPALYLESCVDGDELTDYKHFFSCIKNTSPEASQVYYFILIGLAIIGSTTISRRKSFNYDFEFIELIIFGYFCLLLLSEAQSRYKCLIMPFVCILAAIGAGKAFNIGRGRAAKNE